MSAPRDPQLALLWRFAGYLAGEATPEKAAQWCGRHPKEGPELLEKLCQLLGWQSA